MLYILEQWRVKYQPKRYTLPDKQYRIIQPNFKVKWWKMNSYHNALQYVYTDKELYSILLYLATLDASFIFDIVYHTLQNAG